MDRLGLGGTYIADAGGDADYIDIYFGGPPSTITTGSGGDTIALFASQSPDLAVITDFTVGFGGDVLDLHAVLATTPDFWSLPDFVTLTDDGSGGSIVTLDIDGSESTFAPVDVLVLDLVSGLTAQDLYTNGNLIV